MAFFQMNFFSEALCFNTDINVFIPTPNSDELLNNKKSDYFKDGYKFQVLYLLHGAYGDYTDWMRLTSIEKYAQEHKLAVVMPSASNSFYQDMFRGSAYLTYLTEELPRYVQKLFPVSIRREDTFTAGLSMGGYGATKCALRCPGQYAAFADLSGAVDPGELEPKMIAMGFGFFRYDLIFGGSDKVKGTEDDLYKLAKGLKDAPVKPQAHVYCGLEDTANYGMNKRLADDLRESGFDVSFTDGHGLHDWVYWDSCIADFLKKVKASRESR